MVWTGPSFESNHLYKEHFQTGYTEWDENLLIQKGTHCKLKKQVIR